VLRLEDLIERSRRLSLFLVVLAPPPAALAHDPFVWFDPIGWDNHQDINYKIDDSIRDRQPATRHI
jgi:hypothetical protein